MEPDGREVMFLRNAVTQLTKQLEEQTILMDDMAAELRERGRNEARIVRSGVIAEGKMEAYTKRLEHQVMELEMTLDSEIKARHHLEEQLKIAAHPTDSTETWENTTATITYLQKSLLVSESKYMRDTAAHLAEINLAKKHFVKVSQFLSTLMLDIRDLTKAAASDSPDTDPNLFLSTPLEVWEDLCHSLRISDENPSPTDDSSLCGTYLDRLAGVAENCLGNDGTVDVEKLKTESDGIMKDLRTRHGLDFSNFEKIAQRLQKSLSCLSTEVHSCCSIYGTQRRALHTIKQDLNSKKVLIADLERELARVTSEMSGCVNSAAALNEANAELEAAKEENRMIKLFMSRMKMSEFAVS